MHYYDFDSGITSEDWVYNWWYDWGDVGGSSGVACMSIDGKYTYTRTNNKDDNRLTLRKSDYLSSSNPKVIAEVTIPEAEGGGVFMPQGDKCYESSLAGKLFFTVHYYKNDTGSAGTKMYSVNLDGTGLKQFGKSDYDYRLAGAGDKGVFFYKTKTGEARKLLRADIDGSNEEETPATSRYGEVSDVTRDGAKAILTYPGEERVVAIVSMDTGDIITQVSADITKSVFPHGMMGYSGWSPDGKYFFVDGNIFDASSGELIKSLGEWKSFLYWQPAPPEEAPIDTKKPVEEPAPAPDPLGNAEYVNYIYQTCLARVPDNTAAFYWTDKLDNGMSRTEFYTTVVNTQEAKDKALCTGSIPPTPAPDPTEPDDPPVDSKKPEEETPAPPPAPTAYAEPASKLVIPNTPYILRTKTSTGTAILIRASAYGTGQYVRLSDKAAVTSFLQTQKDLGKSVKTCVSHRPVNSTNARLVIKRLNSTSQMISVPRSPAYGDLCTTAIPVTSTMVTNPNLTTVSATGYDVTIDMITLRAE
jgi:hypothetical protein